MGRSVSDMLVIVIQMLKRNAQTVSQIRVEEEPGSTIRKLKSVVWVVQYNKQTNENHKRYTGGYLIALKYRQTMSNSLNLGDRETLLTSL